MFWKKVPSVLLLSAAALSPLFIYSGVYEPLWFFKEKFITSSLLMLLAALFIFAKERISLSGGKLTAYSIYILSLLLSYFFSQYKNADQLVFQSSCLLALALFDRRPDTRKFFDALIFFSAALSSLAIAEKAGLDLFGWSEGFTGIASTMGNPNYMAALLCAVLPLPVYEFLRSESRAVRAFYFISFLAIMSGVMLTFTRSAWAASVLTLLFLAFREKRRLKGRFHFLAVVLASAIAVAVLMPQVKASALSALDFRSPSLVQRYLMWKVSLDMAIDNPFAGVGIGNYGRFYLRYQSPYASDQGRLKFINDTDNAHNLFLHVFAEQGITGLAALIYLIVFWLKNSGPRVLYPAVSIMAVSIFTSSFYLPPVFLVAALIMSGKGDKGGPIPLTVGQRSIFAVLTLVLLVSGLSSFASNVYLEKGLKKAHQGDYAAARLAFADAAALNGSQAEAPYFTGILEGNGGNHAAAIISLEKSLKMGYIHNDVHFHLGKLYGMTGRGPAEKKLYRKAKSINPFIVIND